ncbi:MAG: glycoside hydrolase family 99-like domain-containing protein, partial [Alphaproteobacteria bacterium]
MMGITGQTDVRLIAFYLPQFHPIPENDEWWGKGFTEWTNVARARSYFAGHEHPRIPGELGFYDLRLPDVREQQAILARAHGIHGFCYYDYWFAGRRLLERPFDEVLASGKPDFPFCVCWANENWTRRWDGRSGETLIEQKHTPDSDAAYIRHLLPIIRDPRYIRVNGAPLILIYRPGLLPDAGATVAAWRHIARDAGIPSLFVCAVQSFEFTDPRPSGFDAAVEFPPHHLGLPESSRQVRNLDPTFEGKIYDYRQAAHLLMNRRFDEYLTFRTV